MTFRHFALFIFVVTFSKTFVEATRCQPLSTFRIDCDECRCSEDGTEYSCTAKQCGIQAPDEKDSYVLDDPPKEDENIEFAYLNDAGEIKDKTNNDDDDDDDDEDDDDDDDDVSEYYEYPDESSEKEWDSGIPEAYRRKRTVYNFRGKRYIKHGKRYVGPVGKK